MNARYWLMFGLLLACREEPTGFPEPAPCAARNPTRNAYFGDLHVHTRFSFDAYAWGGRASPEDAYAFARGEALDLPGAPGFRLRRPLDFAAVTDHGEYLGEAYSCDQASAAGYDSQICQRVRAMDDRGLIAVVQELLQPSPERRSEVCGGSCDAAAMTVWRRLQRATEEALDRSETCSFTTFHGYEWTGNTGGSNLHRNVLFGSESVVSHPISYIEAPSPARLWEGLSEACLPEEGCEALAIPHNSNLSNGAMFAPDLERVDAERRARLEPLMELFQHKGASECFNGVPGLVAAPDELCEVEQIRELDPGEPWCSGDESSGFGIVNDGCVDRRDFLQGALVGGLRDATTLGFNPLRLGVVGSSDTHVGAAGAVEEARYVGHVAQEEATVQDRLQPARIQPAGIRANPGGLTGVWAEENSRASLFAALKRREVFATSGTRIRPRFFGGWGLPEDLCAREDAIARAYERGVPMGGVLSRAAGDAEQVEAGPAFYFNVSRDIDEEAGDLARIEIIKGWLDASGEGNVRVFPVAALPEETFGVDLSTCATQGDGFSTRCGVWRDPEYVAGQPAYYYLRVVEAPSCRWSWRQCLSLPETERPEGCRDETVARVTREMAWSSPIWLED